MTTTSQVPAITTYLVTACQESASLGEASPQVYVFDGPQPPQATQELEQVLWIGANPMESSPSVASSVQSWPVLNRARTKDEDGSVTCAAQHWSGDPTVSVHRNGAAAIMAAVELILRGDGSTGPGDASMGGLVLWSGVDSTEWYVRQMANGVAVCAVFAITYKARLVTS